MDKLNEMPLGEKVIAGSGILLLIFSFFTWFKKDFGATVFGQHIGGTYNGHNGWGGIFSLLGILVAIALVAVVVIRRFTSVELPEKLGNLTWAQVYLIAGLASFVLVLLQIIVGQSVSGVSLDRSIWAFLGLLASAGVAAGAFLCFRDTTAGTTPNQGGLA